MARPGSHTSTRFFLPERIAAAVIPFVFLFSEGVSGQPAGIITRVQGTVTVKRPGSEQASAVAQGDAVSAGDELRTGETSGAQMTFLDGCFVNLFPESSMRVNQYSFDINAGRRTARVRIIGGKARFVLYKIQSNDSVFLIATNTASVAADTLGDFGISAGRSETEVAALDRSVRVKNASALTVGEVSLGANQKTVVRGGSAPLRPVTLTDPERAGYRKDIRTLRSAAQNAGAHPR